MTESVGDALLREIARVRDEVMPAYIEVGAPGALALMLMRQEMNNATRALAEQDAVECIRCLQSLREFTT